MAFVLKTRTTGIILTTTFFHAFAFFAGAYYLPLYFQVLGASATMAGVWYVKPVHKLLDFHYHLCIG